MQTVEEKSFIDWLVIFCCDCGDLALVLDGAKRCDTCAQNARDEALTLWRAAINHATKRFFQDEITCGSCSETAVTYTGPVCALDGIRGQCESCGAMGRVSVDTDDGQSAYARFIVKEDE